MPKPSAARQSHRFVRFMGVAMSIGSGVHPIDLGNHLQKIRLALTRGSRVTMNRRAGRFGSNALAEKWVACLMGANRHTYMYVGLV